MTADLLATVECETSTPVAGSVIWLHGLGADGHDFEPIVPELRLPATGLRFVFPHAPVRPVTLNGGIPMRAWFDIRELDRDADPDEQGMAAAELQVHALIRLENERGISTERIVLAGFSQGGTIALRTGLCYPERLAGVLALSTFLPRSVAVQGAANRKTPIFLAHGSQDPLVPQAFGEDTRDFLITEGYSVEWKTYDMPHAVCPEEIGDVRRWLQTVFKG